MNGDYWLKQSKDKALFEDLLWSRPESKRNAGKLLIIGGNTNGFKSPATAYNMAEKAGAGSIRVMMPISLRSSVAKYIDEPLFAPANISGGFAREALAELLDQASWSDLTLLAGDFGHNSETSILLETFTNDFKGALCLSGDSIDSFLSNTIEILNREKTLIVGDFSKLQKVLTKSSGSIVITSTMSLILLVDRLRALTLESKSSVITYHQGYFIVATNGRVSTSEAPIFNDWELSFAAYGSVWWLQNKDKQFEALSTAIFEATH